jgi:hypothetical protein
MATPPDFVAGQVLTAAQMNAVGMWLVRSATFSAVSTVTADNVFTADYQDYLLVSRYTTSTTNTIRYVNRAAGSNATTNYNEQNLNVTSTTVSGSRATAQARITFGPNTDGNFVSTAQVYISGPALAEATVFNFTLGRNLGAFTVPTISINVSNHSTATAYDGFQLFVDSGTFTGNYSLYGLRR